MVFRSLLSDRGYYPYRDVQSVFLAVGRTLSCEQIKKIRTLCRCTQWVPECQWHRDWLAGRRDDDCHCSVTRSTGPAPRSVWTEVDIEDDEASPVEDYHPDIFLPPHSPGQSQYTESPPRWIDSPPASSPQSAHFSDLSDTEQHNILPPPQFTNQRQADYFAFVTGEPPQLVTTASPTQCHYDSDHSYRPSPSSPTPSY